jgi:hypothetical protein
LGTQQKGQQTDQVAETLESEEIITPQTLGSLVDQKAEAKAKPIRQKMSAYETSNKKLLKQVEVLTKEVKELKASKGSRGAGCDAASTTQSNHFTSPSSPPKATLRKENHQVMVLRMQEANLLRATEGEGEDEADPAVDRGKARRSLRLLW